MNIAITGASNGIGYQTALLLAMQGHTVFAIARSKNNLEELSAESRKRNPSAALHAIVADITNDASMKNIEAKISSVSQSLHVLINNAGRLINKPFGELTAEDWQEVYTTNIFAPANLIKKLVPLFSPSHLLPFSDSSETEKRRNGETEGVRPHILNISSMGGFQGSAKFKGLSAYSSSKAALACLTECLAEEFKEKNIAVNCLCLGSVQTEMFSAAFPQFKAAITTEEMARFIAQFATEGQKFFNGKIIPVSITTP
jgi:3-oxoacyl-[acyl-carrier protein] reductase